MSSTGYGSIEGIARFTNSSSVGELIVNFNSPGIYKQTFSIVDFIHFEKYDDLTRKCENSFATILIVFINRWPKFVWRGPKCSKLHCH